MDVWSKDQLFSKDAKYCTVSSRMESSRIQKKSKFGTFPSANRKLLPYKVRFRLPTPASLPAGRLRPPITRDEWWAASNEYRMSQRCVGTDDLCASQSRLESSIRSELTRRPTCKRRIEIMSSSGRESERSWSQVEVQFCQLNIAHAGACKF